jgi:DNA-binding beta-propeller fold protein YncE
MTSDMMGSRRTRWIAGAAALAGMTLVPAWGQALAPSQGAAGQAGHGGWNQGDGPFRRVASFPVFLNTSEDLETVAEIVAAADEGRLLVYTDSETDNVGFVDISDPSSPQAAGVVDVGGEPTSVAVRDGYALVCVNTSPDFVNTSGDLQVIDIASRTIVRTIPLGGQPDAIAVSPNGRFAAIAIENERDEDLGNGEPPQAPPGFVVIVDTVGPPAAWGTRQVDLVGIPDLYPDDPEPEYVDISALNIAAVTCQENNHIVLIRLVDGRVVADFPAGTADLDEIDTLENDLIEQTASLTAVPREPDAVAWTSPITFATADEGDLFGGSRGFTTWLPNGFPLYQAGNTIEHEAARLGHYPEGRSENKGTEPEGVEFGRFGPRSFLFVGSERSNIVLVYELRKGPILGNAQPRLRQVLPTGVGPEGLLAIPERGLFVVACEDDARDDRIRSTVMIYEYCGESTYPTIRSADRPGTSVPIPWAALSGLVADPSVTQRAYTIYDSFYQRSRIFGMDVGQEPALIDSELVLSDVNGVLLTALDGLKSQLPGTDDFDPAALVNADGTVNLDPEGIAIDADGAFWVASEGTGNLVGGVSDPDNRPFERPNLLLEAVVSGGSTATIEQVVLPPLELTRNQLRFGFEGVAAVGDDLYVAFQRAWTDAGDPSDRARIGRYDRNSGTWEFVYYPLEAPTSPNGGWVGLSELTWLGGDELAVIERDNQGGPDGRIKRIYSFSIGGLTFRDDSQAPGFDLVTKTLELDLVAADVYGPTGGLLPEKQEGLAVLADGSALIVNDNDGVDDNSGETQLIVLPELFD